MSLDISFHIHADDTFEAKGYLIGDEPALKIAVGYDQEVTIFLGTDSEPEKQGAVLRHLGELEDAVRAARAAYLHILNAPAAP